MANKNHPLCSFRKATEEASQHTSPKEDESPPGSSSPSRPATLPTDAEEGEVAASSPSSSSSSSDQPNQQQVTEPVNVLATPKKAAREDSSSKVETGKVSGIQFGKYVPWEDATAMYGVRGLYQLMDIHNDEQNLSLVEKVITSKSAIMNYCNDIIPNSANELSNVIHFGKLNSVQHRPHGLLGPKHMLLRFMEDLGVLPKDHTLARDLTPGIYALSVNAHTDGDKHTFVFYWPQADTFSNVSPKNLSCNIICYLMQLCRDVYLCLDGELVKAFPSSNTAQSSYGRSQRGSIFEVKNKVTQEDTFTLHEGFWVDDTKKMTTRTMQGTADNSNYNGVVLVPGVQKVGCSRAIKLKRSISTRTE